jgi:hypothetical protein
MFRELVRMRGATCEQSYARRVRRDALFIDFCLFGFII